MPIYEYTCQKCESPFELLVRSDDVPQCPQCQSRQLEKMLSLPAAHSVSSSSLPVCDGPASGRCGMGGCGLPECG
ncbi:MAG: zinc ribbon domain-containing protein [Pirellulales bacterium]